MLIMCHCIDHANQQQARLTHLHAHLSWVEANMNAINVAGPLLNADGEIDGSMYVLTADSIQGAQHLLSQDPYHQAAIWQKIIIKEFKDYAGTWVGGKNWPGASESH